MKKNILLSLLFISSYAHAMDSNKAALGFDDSELTFNKTLRKKIKELSLYNNSTDLFPYVKVTLDTGEERQQIQYEEGKLVKIEETGGSECLIILQNGKNRRLFPSSITDIEKALTPEEKELESLRTFDPNVLFSIDELLSDPTSSNSIIKAKITYQDNGKNKIITGHISKPTEKKYTLGRYSVLPIMIKAGRKFEQKEIPVAHIIAIEESKLPLLPRSKSASPRPRRKNTIRRRSKSTKT